MAQHWIPLESNPEVMNEYLARLGVPSSTNIAFSDVWGLDSDALVFIPRPIYALLLLFPDSAVDRSVRKMGTVVAPESDSPFWMKQTIRNACGTMAILHALANIGKDVDLGTGPLKRILRRLHSLQPLERAASLETDQDLAAIHEQSSLLGQTEAPDAQESVDLHFIAFVGYNGSVCELDGNKDGPVVHGEYSGDNSFLEVAVGVIKQFIECDPNGNSFTVISLGGRSES